MPAEPKQQRALKTRDDILRGAALAFEDFGYKGASMREIAARSGVTLGAVYFHFAGKQELARAVILAQPDVMVPKLQSAGIQRLVDLTLVWAHEINANPVMRAAVRLAVEQQAHGIEEDTSFQEWEVLFRKWLEEARDEGELAPGASTGAVAEFMVGAMTGMQHHARLTGKINTLGDRVVRMWQLLLPGLTTPDVAARLDLDPRRGAA
ncbi:ScbR family autoregulator-binding transcription factor [Streptomyces sp. NPDC052309]|uniref:ScbR family autoregulator-binding transcription factor n=1 Tax=Streptomyces sp. NPDC052309 TaxID=3155421 RepID=UPI00343DB822